PAQPCQVGAAAPHRAGRGRLRGQASRRAGCPQDDLGQVADVRLGAVVADVHDLPGRFRRGHQPQHGLDGVLDIAARAVLVGAGPRSACSVISGMTWSAPMRGPYTLWKRPTTARNPRARPPWMKPASPSSLLIAYANRGAVLSAIITGAVSAVGTSTRPAST